MDGSFHIFALVFLLRDYNVVRPYVLVDHDWRDILIIVVEGVASSVLSFSNREWQNLDSPSSIQTLDAG